MYEKNDFYLPYVNVLRPQVSEINFEFCDSSDFKIVNCKAWEQESLQASQNIQRNKVNFPSGNKSLSTAIDIGLMRVVDCLCGFLLKPHSIQN